MVLASSSKAREGRVCYEYSVVGLYKTLFPTLMNCKKPTSRSRKSSSIVPKLSELTGPDWDRFSFDFYSRRITPYKQ